MPRSSLWVNSWIRGLFSFISMLRLDIYLMSSDSLTVCAALEWPYRLPHMPWFFNSNSILSALNVFAHYLQIVKNLGFSSRSGGSWLYHSDALSVLQGLYKKNLHLYCVHISCSPFFGLLPFRHSGFYTEYVLHNLSSCSVCGPFSPFEDDRVFSSSRQFMQLIEF